LLASQAQINPEFDFEPDTDQGSTHLDEKS
jgi:hypothetical protein